MMAADNVSTPPAPLSANLSRNWRRLRARAPMIASAYSYQLKCLLVRGPLTGKAHMPSQRRGTAQHCTKHQHGLLKAAIASILPGELIVLRRSDCCLKERRVQARAIDLRSSST